MTSQQRMSLWDAGYEAASSLASATGYRGAASGRLATLYPAARLADSRVYDVPETDSAILIFENGSSAFVLEHI